MRTRRRIVKVAVLPTSMPLSDINPVGRGRIFQDDLSRDRQLRDQTLRIGQIEGDSKRGVPRSPVQSTMRRSLDSAARNGLEGLCFARSARMAGLAKPAITAKNRQTHTHLGIRWYDTALAGRVLTEGLA